MNCLTCGYALWNLRTRNCPECGESFAPSQFRFVPGAVAFCCPHCDQAYYGTDEQGHLNPKEFHCVQCAHSVAMDEMVMRPAEGVDERETHPTSVPWLDASRGGFRAFVGTVVQALFAPLRLGAGLRAGSSVPRAWMFALLAVLANTLLLVLPIMLFVALLGVMFAGGPGGVAIGFLIIPLVVALLFGLIASFIGIIIWGALAHALLRMTGETPHTIGRTYECICYSTAANVASAIPCLGWYFGWVWWVVSAVLILKEGQRVSGGRAAFATLSPPALLLLLYFGFVGTVLVLAPPPAAPPMFTVQPTQPMDAQTSSQNMLAALTTYARVDSGHAARMIPDGYAHPSMFIVSSSGTRTIDVYLGRRGSDGATLADMEIMPVSEQYEVVQMAADLLPENTIAHRVGDFVFTYHGIRLRGADPRLWLLITSPDPESEAGDSFDGEIIVGQAMNRTRGIGIEEFDAALEAQNRVRAEHGLAPLPHPRTITHDRPAAGVTIPEAEEEE